jgi:hypothetical protein
VSNWVDCVGSKVTTSTYLNLAQGDEAGQHLLVVDVRALLLLPSDEGILDPVDELRPQEVGDLAPGLAELVQVHRGPAEDAQQLRKAVQAQYQYERREAMRQAQPRRTISFDWLAIGTKTEAMSLPPTSAADAGWKAPAFLRGLRTEMSGESLRTK